MGNSSMSRCVQQGEAASANTGNNATCNADDMCVDPAPVNAPNPNPIAATAGSIPGSQQYTTGWKLGDPICPVDRASYTKRVADRILYDLDQIDKKNSVWTSEEKKKVSAGVAGIACNMHESWCLSGNVLQFAIGGPLGRIYNPKDPTNSSGGGCGIGAGEQCQ
jgi:hypothetical protein